MKKQKKERHDYERVSGSGTNQVFKKKQKKQQRNLTKQSLREQQYK